MRVSIRSFLAAGLGITAVGVVVSPPGVPLAREITTSPAVTLSAAVSPLVPAVSGAAAADYAPAAAQAVVDPHATAALRATGDFIINAYNAIEPWVAYGFELVQWGMSFVPGLWWLAPGVDLLYYTVEPTVQSLVYSFAYLISGQFSLIGPELRSGIDQSASNFVQYGIDWLASLIPFPPIPPLPPWPFAAAATAGSAAAVGRGTAVVSTAAEDTAAELPAAEDTAAELPAKPIRGTSREFAARAGGRAGFPAERRNAAPAPAAATGTSVDHTMTAAEPSGVTTASGPAQRTTGKAAAARSGR